VQENVRVLPEVRVLLAWRLDWQINENRREVAGVVCLVATVVEGHAGAENEELAGSKADAGGVGVVEGEVGQEALSRVPQHAPGCIAVSFSTQLVEVGMPEEEDTVTDPRVVAAESDAKEDDEISVVGVVTLEAGRKMPGPVVEGNEEVTQEQGGGVGRREASTNLRRAAGSATSSPPRTTTLQASDQTGESGETPLRPSSGAGTCL